MLLCDYLQSCWFNYLKFNENKSNQIYGIKSTEQWVRNIRSMSVSKIFKNFWSERIGKQIAN